MSEDIVYVLQPKGAGTVKIGHTRADRLERRVAEIQTGNHAELTVVRTFRGGKKKEAELHRRFSAERLTGEWFRLTESLSAELGLNDEGFADDPMWGMHNFHGRDRRTYTYYGRRSLHAYRTPLRLYWEVSCDPYSDGFDPEETSASELWRLWRKRYPRTKAEIYWYVEAPSPVAIEYAPFQDTGQDWLTYYTWPARDGDSIKWTSLPVVNKQWTPLIADKGGFIQAATGWKPAPFQRFVDLDQLERLCGLVGGVG